MFQNVVNTAAETLHDQEGKANPETPKRGFQGEKEGGRDSQAEREVNDPLPHTRPWH